MEPATPYSGHALRIRKDGKVTDRTLPPSPKTQFAGQLDHLAEAVQKGTDVIVPGEEGLADLRVIEAIYRSAREGRRVRLKA